jgi:hypothetical protein
LTEADEFADTSDGECSMKRGHGSSNECLMM